MVAYLFEDARSAHLSQNRTGCIIRSIEKACHFPAEEAEGDIINFGDSHAYVTGYATLELAQRYKFNYTQLSQNGCPYVIGASRWNDVNPFFGCNSIYEDWQRHLLSLPPSVLIHYARWPLYLSGSRFDNQEGGREEGVRASITPEGTDKLDNKRVGSLLKRSIQKLLNAGHTVVIVYPIPEVGWDVPKKIKEEFDKLAMGKTEAAFHKIELTTSYLVYKERARESWEILDGLGKDKNLLRVFPDKIFCKEETQRCYTHNKEVLYYTDDDHVSPYGARLIIGEIEKKLIDSGVLTP